MLKGLFTLYETLFLSKFIAFADDKPNIANYLSKGPSFPTMFQKPLHSEGYGYSYTLLHFLLVSNTRTVKPVLETTCIKRPPVLRDHCS